MYLEGYCTKSTADPERARLEALTDFRMTKTKNLFFFNFRSTEEIVNHTQTFSVGSK